MNINKIFIFMLLILGLSVSVNAITTTGGVAYWTADDVFTDSTGNGHALTNSGTTFNTGKINNGFEFDGSSDFVTIAHDSAFTNSTFSVSYWVKFDDLVSQQYTIFKDAGGNNNGDFSMIYQPSTNTLNTNIQSGASQDIIVGEVINDNNFHFITFTSNGLTSHKIYLDGNLINTSSFSWSINSNTNKIDIGAFNGATSLDGNIDEIYWTDYVMSQQDITDLYNLGDGSQYPFTSNTPILTFTNITANNITLTNNSFYNSGIDFETTILNTSTNGNINHSYSLNGASLVQYATNSLTGSENLNLSEDYYNISFYGNNNETNVTSSNYSFIVDRTVPVIDIIGNLSQPQFLVNFSTIFNVTDALSGLASCTLTATYLENVTNASQFDKFVNCTDTTTFSAAGLYNGFIEAVDNAGNIATLSVNGTIEPFVSINFFEINSTEVSNYNSVVTHPSGFIETFTNINNPLQISPFFNGSLDLGLYNIEFSKLGYATETFNLTINISSGGTTSNFTVTTSKILVSVFDRSTGLILTGLTSLTGVASVGFTANTTTGYVNISNINFLSESYQIVANHIGYTTENVFFTYNNQELLTVEIFMLQSNNSNFGTATVQVKSSPAELFISNARCDLLEWKPDMSAYESVSQGVTDVNGEYTFNIELNIKLYKVLCTSEGNSQEQILGNGGIITTTGLTYPVLISTTIPVSETKLDTLISTFINTTETNTTQRLTFTWTETNGIVSQGCINIYQSTGFSKSLISQTCASGSSGQIQIIENINNTFTLIAESIVITSDGVSQFLDRITFLSTESFESLINKYHLDLVLPIILFFFGIGLGLTLEPQTIYISLIALFILEWITFAMVPTTISFTTVTFISVIIGFMYWGVNKG